MRPDYEQALLDSGMDAETAAEFADRRGARLAGAPLAVIVCVARNDLKTYDDENRSRGEELMAVQSAALAGGHLLLAAQALGLGSVWMCAPLFVPEIVQTALSLPSDWVAQGMLLLGYPDESPDARQRKPLSEVVRWVS
jgi:nitroreductase